MLVAERKCKRFCHISQGSTFRVVIRVATSLAIFQHAHALRNTRIHSAILVTTTHRVKPYKRFARKTVEQLYRTNMAAAAVY